MKNVYKTESGKYQSDPYGKQAPSDLTKPTNLAPLTQTLPSLPAPLNPAPLTSSQFGDLIDGGYNPIKENVYNLFNSYFEHPRLIKKKDVGEYSMYITKIRSLLTNEYRYLIALVNADANEVGTIKQLLELEWVALQTRTFKENYDILVHSYNPRRYPPLMKKITRDMSNPALIREYNYFVDDLPILITLLPQKGELNEYNQTGIVPVALETFYTIVSFK
jgi:hypothetical protein